MEKHIYHIPVFAIDKTREGIDLSEFCNEAEELLPRKLLQNVEVVYIGNFPELTDRNAAYTDGAIYMTAEEPTIFDMLENFVHEIAHSLEDHHGAQIYTDSLRSEFLSKRHTLYRLLKGEGYHINPKLYSVLEYNEEFDNFLANEVGYPTLVTLTLGLFVSPYGATSLQEYFANGFENYFLESPRLVEQISPALYAIIESIVQDD